MKKIPTVFVRDFAVRPEAQGQGPPPILPE